MISSWVMWKSDFHMAHVEIWFLFTSATDDFTNFSKRYGNLSMAISYSNSYRNMNSSSNELKSHMEDNISIITMLLKSDEWSGKKIALHIYTKSYSNKLGAICNLHFCPGHKTSRNWSRSIKWCAFLFYIKNCLYR